MPNPATFGLRDYQRELLKRVSAALEPDRARVMMQLPTGGGKTIIAAHLLADYLAGGRKAVWVTHRMELAHQTDKRLTEAAGILADSDRSDWKAGTGLPAPAMANGVKILMAQTVGRRVAKSDIWGRYNADDLMVIDEAHHATAKGWESGMKHWPGRILGMTATPWRLSLKEGFDHIFDKLICGPQVTELQSERSLCMARTLIPASDQRILGGSISSTGDYTEGGIERANDGRPDVMTAGALRFWQKCAQDRQTIVYAVSKRHARNLVNVFNESGVSAELILGDTPTDDRAEAIARFDRGDLQVLVNVAVATEGFDIPDASCVVIARPTESLALYLQMLGRGLRPKSKGGDCVILDLAGNSTEHGLPEERRDWTLAPRIRASGMGEAPVVVCVQCSTASPAASHYCEFCGAPLGKDCNRCGKWRAWNRWRGEKTCDYSHDHVCDLCHNDAHIQNHLPTFVMEEGLSSEIERLTSRVVADRKAFEKKVKANANRIGQPELDALHLLSKEHAQFEVTVNETEYTVQMLNETIEQMKRQYQLAVERSGLDGLLRDALDKPLILAPLRLRLGMYNHSVELLLAEEKTLHDIFGYADSDTMNELRERFFEMLRKIQEKSEEDADDGPYGFAEMFEFGGIGNIYVIIVRADRVVSG